jgi:hypothetical protein
MNIIHEFISNFPRTTNYILSLDIPYENTKFYKMLNLPDDDDINEDTYLIIFNVEFPIYSKRIIELYETVNIYNNEIELFKELQYLSYNLSEFEIDEIDDIEN